MKTNTKSRPTGRSTRGFSRVVEKLVDYTGKSKAQLLKEMEAELFALKQS